MSSITHDMREYMSFFIIDNGGSYAVCTSLPNLDRAGLHSLFAKGSQICQLGLLSFVSLVGVLVPVLSR